jgi:hypothetical protein
MRDSGRTPSSRAWLLLVPVAVLFLHCLYPSVRNAGRPGGTGLVSTQAFSHGKHDDALKKEGFKCTDCHLYELAYMERDRKINEDLTRALTRAGKESCHFCHRTNAERTGVRLKCVDCHVDLRSIRPENHRTGWQTSHGTQVALSEVSCDQCHSNRYCIECHTRRDEADRRFHTGVAIVTHPVEARADPARCQACHHPSYCLRCHKTGRF